MKVKNQHLTIRKKGEEVAALHKKLAKLGFKVPSDERKKKYFGKATREAVSEFQKKYNMKITGIVDEKTAELMAVKAKRPPPSHNDRPDQPAASTPPHTLLIMGQIKGPKPTDAAHLTVKASDMDLRTEDELGVTKSSKKGTYQIHYTREDFTRAEKKSADLRVRAYSPEGIKLAESNILFNAPDVAKIDLNFSDSHPQLISEYETMIAVLTPLLNGIAIADLNPVDVLFLSGETEIGAEIIGVLPASARLSQQTDIATEFFYGLGRRGLLLDDLDALLDKANIELIDAIKAAVKNSTIPASIEDRLDEIMQRIEQLRLERGHLVTYEKIGRLLNEADDTPLAGYSAHTFDLESGAAAPDDLGQDVTDQEGQFTLVLILPRPAPDDDQPVMRSLRMHVQNPAGEEIAQTDIQAQLDSATVMEIRIAVPATPEAPSPTVTELADTVELELPVGLVASLAEYGIHTLKDIREAGGISHLDGLPDPTSEPIIRLEAHARLSSLSPELETNAKLIQHGYTSLHTITRASRNEFVGRLQEDLGDFKAAQLQVMAKAQTDYLNTVLAGARADKANGMPTSMFGPPIESETELPEVSSPGCGCKNCNAAVSPAAYLADLFDYTVSHIKQGNTLIDLDYLENNFHQPFGDLPTSCREVDKEVRQVRICIEVLRRFLGPRRLSDDDRENTLLDAEKAYRVEVYTTLLNKLGTSFDEVRQARTDDNLRESLASRLGIAAEHVSSLLLDPENYTEQDLEKLFGLADTNRNPLSEGAKFADSDNQIHQWNLAGVDWNRNTDGAGYVYINLTASGSAYRIECYRDIERTDQVATGETDSPDGTVQLEMTGTSGLSGSITLRYGADNSDIKISAVPEFLSWRMQGLHNQWFDQDWPEDPPADAKPIIDPDLIDLAYLKDSMTSDPNTAHAIWHVRYDWIKAELDGLHSRPRPWDLDHFNLIIEDKLGQPSTRLIELADARRDGENIDADLEALHLSNAAFDTLLRLRTVLDNGDDVLDSEWEDGYNILIQVQKQTRYNDWRTEEEDAGISLSPDFFQIPKVVFEIPPKEPTLLPAWRATNRAQRDWEDRLETRIEQEQAVINALREALDSSEEATITDLREALITATEPVDNDFDLKARAITDRLLIDAKANVCQKATRISQAMATMQNLLWSLRTGQLNESYSDLSLDAVSFEEEWRWLGSYASWRAAMFVFLYPENILHPNYRKWQTPAFRGLVKELRGNSRLSPEGACRAAARYADYFQDICSLRLEASVIARTKTNDGDCRNKSPKGDRHLVYLFARGGETNTVYVSHYDPNDETPYAQDFWEPVPGLENVVDIVGATVYTISPQERYIYLFLRAKEKSEQTLLYTTYDLIEGTWSGEANDLELDLPNDATAYTAVVSQKNRSNVAPQLAIRIPNGAIYSRYMNRDGSDWQDDDWHLLVSRSKGREFNRLHALIEYTPGESCLVTAQDNDSNHVYYRLIGYRNDGKWRTIGRSVFFIYGFKSPASYIGSYSYPDDDRVYVFYNVNSSNAVYYQSIRRLNEDLHYSDITSFDQFNVWFESISGLSLSDLKIDDNEDFDNLLEVLNRANQGQFPRLFAKLYVKVFAKRIVDEKDSLFPEWKYADSRVWLYTENNHGLTSCLNDLLDEVTVKVLDRDDSEELSSPIQWTSGIQDLVYAAGKAPANVSGRVAYRRDFGNIIDIGTMTNDQRIKFQTFGINIIGFPIGTTAGTNLYRADYTRNTNNQLEESSPVRIAPKVTGPFEITEQLSETILQNRRQQIRRAFEQNQGAPASVLTYLEEAWYFVPVLIALQLQQRSHFISALDWFRTVYDYHQPVEERKIYYGLKKEEPPEDQDSTPVDYGLITGWLLDPLNPHAVALTRFNTYTRFTLLSLVRCFLEYGDTEFARDTRESIARARTLYITALELLGLPELNRTANTCKDLIGTLEIELGPEIEEEAPEWGHIWEVMVAELGNIAHLPTLSATIGTIKATLTNSGADWASRFAQAQEVVIQAANNVPVSSGIAAVITQKTDISRRLQTAFLAQPAIYANAEVIGKAAGQDFTQAVSIVSEIDIATLETNKVELSWLRGEITALAAAPDVVTDSTGVAMDTVAEIGDVPVQTIEIGSGVTEIGNVIAHPLGTVNTIKYSGNDYVPSVAYKFCIPPNPMLNALRMHAEVNLYKLRNCRNISGLERELEPYAAPTDTFSGLPTIDGSGSLQLPGTTMLRPTPYRYEVLIERAKQLVSLAQQIEAAFLSALEKRDAELYNLLKSRQDIQLTRSGVRMQGLRLKEARDGVKLAELQKDRVEIQFDHYDGLIREGFIGLESAVIGFMIAAAALHVSAGILSATGWWIPDKPKSAASAASSFAAAASTTASIFQIYADHARRMQEWEYQKTLARQDIRIGAQQVRLANDHVRIVGQERNIAEMQADFAADTLDFLANKFTNAELYDWMSVELGGIYGYFLQQATGMAQLASQQLAFERQENPPLFIKSDYWEAPLAIGAGLSSDESEPDRQGLTGSEQLLQDIFQLDQHAFATDERKLQLTKIISLASMAPAEFQIFRETGVMDFSTLIKMFDQDFPGHYLRLIKQVRISVIALIPPVEGIHATLSTTGFSYFMSSANRNQDPAMIRTVESVALSSPQSATGLFELIPQSQDKRLPFEGIGVATSWVFEMPKPANRFDFNTIADVLIEINYTALDGGYAYRQQVIQELGTDFSADRPFSFRHQFADQWYDLHNPDQTETPMTVSFKTERTDFSPNLDDLRMKGLKLYFATKNGTGEELEATLSFKEDGNGTVVEGTATSIDNIISTLRGNAPQWTTIADGNRSPIGEWELTLPDTDTVKNLFEDEEIEDILFVTTFKAQTPAWP